MSCMYTSDLSHDNIIIVKPIWYISRIYFCNFSFLTRMKSFFQFFYIKNLSSLKKWNRKIGESKSTAARFHVKHVKLLLKQTMQSHQIIRIHSAHKKIFDTLKVVWKFTNKKNLASARTSDETNRLCTFKRSLVSFQAEWIHAW